MTDMSESPDRSTPTRNIRNSNIAAPQSPRRIAIDAKPWHSLDLRQLIGDLGTGTEGLTDQEARGRFEKYGPNRLPEVEPPTWWGILLRQFYNPLILILGVAAAFAFAIGLGTKISGGHFNPAVSTWAWFSGKLTTPDYGTYVLAQVSAGLLVWVLASMT
jgi:magnesium-transporting ATPase (P-type)